MLKIQHFVVPDIDILKFFPHIFVTPETAKRSWGEGSV